MQISQNKMAETVNNMARQGADALGAKLNTQLVREGRGTGQMTDNARKVHNKGAEMIGAKEKTAAKGAEMIEGAKEMSRKGSDALGASLDIQISKGLGSGQMVANVNKMIQKGAEMIGVVEKKGSSETALVDNATKLVKNGVEEIGAELDTKISQGLFGRQMAKNVQEMSDNFAKLRGNEQKPAAQQQPMRQVDLSA